jgi:hypothetical protein
MTMLAALVKVPMAELGAVCEIVVREFPGITSLKHLGGAARPGSVATLNTLAAVAVPRAIAARFASEGFVASAHHQPQSHHSNAHQKLIHGQLLCCDAAY